MSFALCSKIALLAFSFYKLYLADRGRGTEIMPAIFPNITGLATAVQKVLHVIHKQ